MGSQSEEEVILASAHSAVFKESVKLEGNCQKIVGYDFNNGVNYERLMQSLSYTGFQAANLGDAIKIVNQMLDWSLADEPITDGCSDREKALSYRESVKCKLFLGFTSNLISSGVRETIRFLVEHRMLWGRDRASPAASPARVLKFPFNQLQRVDVVVTTAGGIEEDLIKCLAPTFKGDFALPGAELRSKGINRTGNLLVPNSNYCKFETWIMPILDSMLKEQLQQGVLWTPSKVIARLGKEINDSTSYLYWAQKNGIPVFCPSITDGSIGDMLYFHSFRSPGLIVDLVQDVRAMNRQAVLASPRKTGTIILGGGLPKHHINNANMMRNGSDFSVYINTAQEFDGSDSGARPDEAVSWGKIRSTAKVAKVHCDATIAFPILVAETFAKRVKTSDQINGDASAKMEEV